MNIIQMLVDYVINYEYNGDFKISFIDKEIFGNIFLVVEIIYKEEFDYTVLLYLRSGNPYWCVCTEGYKNYEIPATMTNYSFVLSWIAQLRSLEF